MQFEKKCWTNVYWNRNKAQIVAAGWFSDEKSAGEKILSADHMVYQAAVPATVVFDFKGDNIIKEKPVVITEIDAVVKEAVNVG